MTGPGAGAAASPVPDEGHRMPVLVPANAGPPENVPWQGNTVCTGVRKHPMHGPAVVRRLDIDGDGQGDLAGHGGEQRAVLVYQIGSYRYWQRYFGRDEVSHGSFGENLTVTGLADDEVRIGDRYRIGEAGSEVTQPRVTCYRAGLARLPGAAGGQGRAGRRDRGLGLPRRGRWHGAAGRAGGPVPDRADHRRRPARPGAPLLAVVAPDAGTYRISVKLEPHGIASSYLNHHLEHGAVLDVAPPRGHVVLDDGTGPVLLISADIGVTPVLSILHQLAALMDAGACRGLAGA